MLDEILRVKKAKETASIVSQIAAGVDDPLAQFFTSQGLPFLQAAKLQLGTGTLSRDVFRLFVSAYGRNLGLQDLQPLVYKIQDSLGPWSTTEEVRASQGQIVEEHANSVRKSFDLPEQLVPKTRVAADELYDEINRCRSTPFLNAHATLVAALKDAVVVKHLDVVTLPWIGDDIIKDLNPLPSVMVERASADQLTNAVNAAIEARFYGYALLFGDEAWPAPQELVGLRMDDIDRLAGGYGAGQLSKMQPLPGESAVDSFRLIGNYLSGSAPPER